MLLLYFLSILIFQKVLQLLDKNTDYLISDKIKKKQVQINKTSETSDVSIFVLLKYERKY